MLNAIYYVTMVTLHEIPNSQSSMQIVKIHFSEFVSKICKDRRTMWQITAKRHRDRLLQQIASCDVKICHCNLSHEFNWFEFVQHWSDKISASDLLQKQCRRGDLLPWCFTVICRIVCVGLKSWFNWDIKLVIFFEVGVLVVTWLGFASCHLQCWKRKL